MWPAHSPMHSDIDLLVVTRDALEDEQGEELLNETYPLYLECGRQLSPHFFSTARLTAPEDEHTHARVPAPRRARRRARVAAMTP